MDKERITRAVFRAVEEANKELDSDGCPLIKKSLDTDIYGGSSVLDSLGNVTFLFEIDKAVEEEFNMSVAIEYPDAATEKRVITIGMLVDYIGGLLI